MSRHDVAPGLSREEVGDVALKLGAKTWLDPETGCHEWQGAANDSGYGQLYCHGKVFYTHRIAYVLRYGQIIAGLTIDHLCRNTKCCNPEHLELVTQRENNRRGNSPGAITVRTNTCKRGHEFTPDNTYFRPNTKLRMCRACIAFRKQQGPQFHRGPRPLAPCCAKGHEFTPDNTYIRPDTGNRMCRACIRLRKRKYSSRPPADRRMDADRDQRFEDE